MNDFMCNQYKKTTKEKPVQSQTLYNLIEFYYFDYQEKQKKPKV